MASASIITLGWAEWMSASSSDIRSSAWGEQTVRKDRKIQKTNHPTRSDGELIRGDCGTVAVFWTNLQGGKTRWPCRLHRLHLHHPDSASCWQQGWRPGWSAGVPWWWHSWTYPVGQPEPGGENANKHMIPCSSRQPDKCAEQQNQEGKPQTWLHLSDQLLWDDRSRNNRLRLATKKAWAAVPARADHPGLPTRIPGRRGRPPGRSSAATAAPTSASSAAAPSCAASPCSAATSASSVTSIHARAPTTPVADSSWPRSENKARTWERETGAHVTRWPSWLAPFSHC